MAQTGKFIAYYRVSTDKQGKSGLGLEAQRLAVMNYLNGGEWKIIAEFTEVETGKRSDRPQLDAALKAARLHRAAIVVSKVDRLTRSVAFLSKLLESDVDVRFADLPQIEGPTGRFMLQQMASVAELEAGMIADRTKKALAAAKANGKKLGGVRYREDGSRVVMPPSARLAAARAIHRRVSARADDIAPVIWELQGAGAESLRALAKGLNARGIPTARGHGKWSAVQVARLLGNIPEKPTKRDLRQSKIIERLITAGKMSEQQIADWRERGIAPPLRFFSACGMAFDGGPDLDDVSYSMPTSTVPETP
jgi:DNA invertase Pin-like site-specific DNA recombinase